MVLIKMGLDLVIRHSRHDDGREINPNSNIQLLKVIGHLDGTRERLRDHPGADGVAAGLVVGLVVVIGLVGAGAAPPRRQRRRRTRDGTARRRQALTILRLQAQQHPERRGDGRERRHGAQDQCLVHHGGRARSHST